MASSQTLDNVEPSTLSSLLNRLFGRIEDHWQPMELLSQTGRIPQEHVRERVTMKRWTGSVWVYRAPTDEELEQYDADRAW